MSVLIVMRGLPASGKSTRAEQIVRESGNTVRINKDLLRTMLHFDRWSGTRELVTKDVAAAIARTVLPAMNVVIDDTNLHPGVMTGWKRLAQDLGISVRVEDLTDVPVDECVARDAARERSVGYAVIRNMALRYRLHHFEPDSVVLCDLDGTIADITHRLPLLRNGPEGQTNWQAFFAAIPFDGVREEVRAMLDEHRRAGRTVIFLSARPETHRAETTAWLQRHGLTHWTLLMRSADDHRVDVEIKQRLLDAHFPDLRAVHCVIDDRPSVIRGWRARGLTVVDVGAGVEF